MVLFALLVVSEFAIEQGISQTRRLKAGEGLCICHWLVKDFVAEILRLSHGVLDLALAGEQGMLHGL